MLKKKISISKNNDEVIKFMCAMSWIAILFCFFTLYYVDLIIISEYGYTYADYVLTGKFIEFFNSATWSYGITIFTIFAIWSVPVWLYFNILNVPVDLNQTSIYLWYKLLILLFVIWSVFIVMKIAEELYPKFKNYVELNYISSTLLIFPAVAICQCDMIGLCFVLLGILYFIRNNKTGFLLAFAVACTMKYFALFVFLPLLLLEYKHIKQIMCAGLTGGSLIFISLIIQNFSVGGKGYINDPGGDLNRFYITSLSRFSLDRGDNLNQIGMLGIALAIVLILAYITNIRNEQERKEYAIWYATAGYMVFFLNYPVNVYWYCLIAPLLILLAYLNRKNIGLNLTLETIYAGSVLLSSVYLQEHVLFGSKFYSYLLLKKYAEAIPEDVNVIAKVIDTVCPFDFSEIIPTIIGIGFACALMLLIINFPAINKIIQPQLVRNEDEENKVIRIISVVRVLIVYIWLGISIVALIKYN